MIAEETIKENQKFLDKTARKVMIQYLTGSKPKGFADSMSIARVSYKQALAMLEIKLSSLSSLAKESGIMKNDV